MYFLLTIEKHSINFFWELFSTSQAYRYKVKKNIYIINNGGKVQEKLCLPTSTSNQCRYTVDGSTTIVGFPIIVR